MNLLKDLTYINKDELKELNKIIKDYKIQVSEKLINILLENQIDEQIIKILLLSKVPKEEFLKSPYYNEATEKLIENINKINNLKIDNKSEYEDYRNMIVIIANDYKVLIIILILRLEKMIENKKKDFPNKEEFGKNTLHVFAPIAHRIGLGNIKSELEELSLYYMDIDNYKKVVNFLEEKKEIREQKLNENIKNIDDKLKNQIKGYQIKGRNKSIYSIYKKTAKLDKDFSKIYDFQGIRIICKTKEDCYFVLGVIHENYIPIPDRFKDYIALKKPNLYQSLHTGVVDGNGQIFEVQIRTYEMDEIAEKGIAAHWIYKEGKSGSKDDVENQLHLFRDVLDSTKNENEINSEIFESTIYTFTPDNKIIMLPSGASVIDFAYKIHTKVAENIQGAIVNDKIATFSTILKNGDRVNIITKQGNDAPNKQWFEFIKTQHAKRKLKSYLNKKNNDIELKIYKEVRAKVKRAISNKELKYDILEDEKLQSIILNELNVKDLKSLFKEINDNKISISQINQIKMEDSNKVKLRKIKNNLGDIEVKGIDDIKINISKCCKPVYGDEIVGVINNGKYIAIHKVGCKNIDYQKEVEVAWTSENKDKYLSQITMYSLNRQSLLNDIINLLGRNKVALGDIKSNIKDGIVKTQIQIYVKNKSQLNDLIDSLKNIDDVKEVLIK